MWWLLSKDDDDGDDENSNDDDDLVLNTEGCKFGGENATAVGICDERS